jgi:hypothetical protein
LRWPLLSLFPLTPSLFNALPFVFLDGFVLYLLSKDEETQMVPRATLKES